MTPLPAISAASLTRRQRRIWRAIVAYRRKHGESPTREELLKLAAIGSHETLNREICRMRESGFLTGSFNRARNLIAVAKP